MPENKLVQSLLRGTAILERVAGSGNGMTLAELARQLELKPTTVHNLARTLVAGGYLQQRRKPVRYCLGNAVFNLVRAAGKSALYELSRSRMRRLAREHAPSTVTLAEHFSHEIVTSLRLSSDAPDAIEHSPERTLRPYSSASALMFQACWNNEQLALYRQRHPFSEFADPYWKTEAALDRFLAEARARGFVSLDFKEAIHPMAAPVRDFSGEVIAVLGLSISFSARPPRKRIRKLESELVRTASELSDRISNSDTKDTQQ